MWIIVQSPAAQSDFFDLPCRRQFELRIAHAFHRVLPATDVIFDDIWRRFLVTFRLSGDRQVRFSTNLKRYFRENRDGITATTMEHMDQHLVPALTDGVALDALEGFTVSQALKSSFPHREPRELRTL